jgi:hypothetical protein
MPAGHQGGSCRRTDTTGGVGVGEADTLLSQAVEIGRLPQRRSVATQVRPAQVVGNDQHDVRRAIFSSRGLDDQQRSG